MADQRKGKPNETAETPFDRFRQLARKIVNAPKKAKDVKPTKASG